MQVHAVKHQGSYVHKLARARANAFPLTRSRKSMRPLGVPFAFASAKTASTLELFTRERRQRDTPATDHASGFARSTCIK